MFLTSKSSSICNNVRSKLNGLSFHKTCDFLLLSGWYPNSCMGLFCCIFSREIRQPNQQPVSTSLQKKNILPNFQRLRFSDTLKSLPEPNFQWQNEGHIQSRGTSELSSFTHENVRKALLQPPVSILVYFYA